MNPEHSLLRILENIVSAQTSSFPVHPVSRVLCPATLTLDSMNLKEVALDEMELHNSLLEEGLSCLLHTTLFVRSPGSVTVVLLRERVCVLSKL